MSLAQGSARQLLRCICSPTSHGDVNVRRIGMRESGGWAFATHVLDVYKDLYFSPCYLCSMLTGRYTLKIHRWFCNTVITSKFSEGSRSHHHDSSVIFLWSRITIVLLAFSRLSTFCGKDD